MQNNIEIDRTLGDGVGESQKWKSRSVTSVLDSHQDWTTVESEKVHNDNHSKPCLENVAEPDL